MWTLPFAGMGKPWVERSCRPLGQAWTDQGSLQLPFAESPVSAWPGLRLQAFNLRMLSRRTHLLALALATYVSQRRKLRP